MSLLDFGFSTDTALVFSLLSVWVLVTLFVYLGSCTRRRCFRMWTAGWLFYAISLTLELGRSQVGPTGLLDVLRNGAISTAAVLMFWGSFDFLGLPATSRLIGLTVLFNSMWSFATGLQFPDSLWGQLPAFLLLAAAGVFTGISFWWKVRASHRTAALLTFGFALWALYLVIFPFLKRPEPYLAVGLLVACALQLFIAVSMVACVLEEMRRNHRTTETALADERAAARSLVTQLEEREQTHQALLQEMNEAIVIARPEDLKILALNNAARRMFQISETQSDLLLGDYCSLRNQSSGSSRDLARQLPSNPSLELTLQDGSKIRAEVRCQSIRHHGEPALQLLFTETNPRASLARQMRHDSKISALGQVISGVAHELNNPLAAIKGYADLLLLTAPVDQQTRAVLLNVSQESHRAAKLVHDLLAFARPEMPQVEPTNLRELIQEFTDGRKGEIVAQGIEVRCSFAGASPVVLASRRLLQQVLAHLLTNAVEALQGWEGERTIEISLRTIDATAQIVVEDSGPGVPEEIAQRIFEPFFTTKPLGTGTGLGLSLCYTIVMQHHGKLYQRDSECGGTRMIIELPVATVCDPRPEPKNSQLDFRRESKAGAHSKVLVIDDEPFVGALVKDMLSFLGCEATVRTSAREALADLERSPFDLIVSDFRMPGMNGGEFFHRAIALDERYHHRFLLITGDNLAEDVHRFLQETKTPCLLKPFQIEGLRTAVAEITDREESEVRSITA